MVYRGMRRGSDEEEEEKDREKERSVPEDALGLLDEDQVEDVLLKEDSDDDKGWEQ